ncbi:hypothetical protein N1028_04670 [Herbiconiux sp. CPCC 203407]|uniref:Uncharacterized protein n=1 Tax=Herbiconiux oxytropis TaxID=2970915 RepID=A0AA42BVZ5_9MICO|nr:hypothetical protein [Herbiconiux oxytropis]MCS5723005.1 hypothetical protein [Herbiconiux oxytropis]MCS5725183.1 hypothetical protein [Herbiconiux oxytropis]
MDPAVVDKRTALHRSIVIYTGLLLLTLAAVFASVGILNRELYSASSFVRMYLEALAEHDVEAALATPGVDLGTDDEPGTGSASLVVPDALSRMEAITEVSDTEIVPGRHRIVYSYTLAAGGADGSPAVTVPGQTEFDVVQTGMSWLFFPEWEFSRSPTAHAGITVSHAADILAGTSRVAVGAPGDFRASGEYEVLVPSLTMLSHRSTYLGALPTRLTATKPSASVSAIVDVQPTTAFVSTVQATVDEFLDSCADEPLLYPPGCPFGLDVDDRIVSEPSWSIEAYPVLTILAGQESWVVPNATGAARVKVDIRSLFDGTVSTRDELVAFDTTFSLSIDAEGAIVFGPRG